MTNLANISADLPATTEKVDDDGLPFLKIMLHEDGLGPSRLPLPHLFENELGVDYEVAIPEQTCAIAYRKNLSAIHAENVDAIISGCYEKGTEPMSPNVFKAHEFLGFSVTDEPSD